ncbi:hypothetical protein N9C92_01310 [Candidatus Pelagibacter sp.]|jgi:hypothetical protein|nr:hypothetical protein [Candidatus Pelagibacter sp.]
MKKKETKKEIENRIRKELLDEQSINKLYDSKKRSNVIWIGIFGAIIGIVYVSFTYPYANVAGIILGGITGGLIGVGLGDHFS